MADIFMQCAVPACGMTLL